MKTLAHTLHAQMQHCRLCPRGCGVNRLAGQRGYCGLDGGLHIAAITRHRGEEPVLSGPDGMCNVFFSHCNLQCVYCQNSQISRNSTELPGGPLDFNAALERIMRLLDTGIERLGFVSPTHMVPQMAALVEALWQRGRHPVIVYNSGGYESAATLRLLEGLVDVYLPDCKYMDAGLARACSGAADYPEKAAAALREMYRQMGRVVQLDEQGLIRRGLIVRHLVLPGQTANSVAVLRFLARELSPGLSLSLMAQYCPNASVRQHPQLGRRLLASEYQSVLAEMERLGFVAGFAQKLASAENYWPDFSRDEPFDSEAGQALRSSSPKPPSQSGRLVTLESSTTKNT